MIHEEEKVYLINLTKEGRFKARDIDTLFTKVEGYLTDVSIRTFTTDGVEGEFLRLLLKWQKNVYIFSFNIKYSVANRIFNILPNIDVNSILSIKAYKDKEGYANVVLEQHSMMVPYYYTKDDPKGKPIWTKNPDGTWDNTNELNFFRAQVYTFNQALKKINHTLHNPSTAPAFPDDPLFDEKPPF
jgi:hypothetical protein